MNGGPERQQGFTLVELMIAMVLGLLLVAAAIHLFLSNHRTYQLQDAIGRLQENARFVVEVLGRDIRAAGFAGCRSLGNGFGVSVIADENHDGEGDPDLLPDRAGVRGFDHGDGWHHNGSLTPVASADVLRITHAGKFGAPLERAVHDTSAQLHLLSPPHELEPGDLLMIGDCRSADLFIATAVSSGHRFSTVAHSAVANASNRLSRRYGTSARVRTLHRTSWFLARNPAGEPALYRREDDHPSEELIAGVQDMQFLFGVDSDGDGVPNDYETAAQIDDWDQVMSVTADLLLESLHGVGRHMAYSFAGEHVARPADMRLHRGVTATFDLRNRSL
ncbi:MAG: PilW family protein [Gammaproteobacteria bacterium]|jgi:type IV pilus assembly protein PilW